MTDTTTLECLNCNFEEEKTDLEWWDLVADTWTCPKCGQEWKVGFEEMGNGGIFLLESV